MRPDIKGNIEFKESQQLRGWIWLLAISPLLASIGVAIFVQTQIQKDESALMGLLVVIPINAVILYLIYAAKFEIIVTDWAIYYRWLPFRKKFSMISRFDIAEARVKKRPFGQLGYKRGVWGYGRVHTAGSSHGLQFTLKSGRKIFIGSGKIKGFERAVEKLVEANRN